MVGQIGVKSYVVLYLWVAILIYCIYRYGVFM